MSLLVAAQLDAFDGRIVLAAVAAGVAVAALAALVFPPVARLGPRVRPYTVSARRRLGHSADVMTAGGHGLPGGSVWRLWGPPLQALTRKLARFRSADADELLAQKLRQASVPMTIDEFRLRQMADAAIWGLALGFLGGVILKSPVWALAFCAGGVAVGACRRRGRLDSTVENRRARMRIELYSINQQLAMYVRASPGLVKHIERLVQRGRGEVVAELADVLRWIRSGMSVTAAFARAADTTPEPWAARTYRLLGIADERGADLAGGLLALSEEIRDARREDMRRAAVKRTGAMLLPTIGILAPTMLLFIAAPLPTILFGVA